MTDDRDILQTAADRLAELADRTTTGRWRIGGLLASRPEIIAEHPDGSTEHVAEARAATAAWISAVSPAVAAPLVAWLRAAAEQDAPVPEALDVARALLAGLDRNR